MSHQSHLIPLIRVRRIVDVHVFSPVKPPASNHRIPDRKPQSYRCMFMCVCDSECLFLCVFLEGSEE